MRILGVLRLKKKTRSREKISGGKKETIRKEKIGYISYQSVAVASLGKYLYVTVNSKIA